MSKEQIKPAPEVTIPIKHNRKKRAIGEKALAKRASIVAVPLSLGCVRQDWLATLHTAIDNLKPAPSTEARYKLQVFFTSVINEPEGVGRYLQEYRTLQDNRIRLDKGGLNTSTHQGSAVLGELSTSFSRAVEIESRLTRDKFEWMWYCIKVWKEWGILLKEAGDPNSEISKMIPTYRCEMLEAKTRQTGKHTDGKGTRKASVLTFMLITRLFEMSKSFDSA